MKNRKKKKVSKSLSAFTASLVLLSTFLSPMNALISEASAGSQQIVFTESLSASQSKTFTIPNLERVTSISSDTGIATYSVNGDEITINVSGGTASRTVWEADYYSKTATGSKTSSSQTGFTDTIPYSDTEGYNGTLSKNGSSTVLSGTYTPFESKTVTDTRTSSANNLPSSISYDNSGYKGTLMGQGVTTTQIPHTTWIPAETKIIYDSRTTGTGGEPASLPSSLYYNYSGFSGYLNGGNAYVISGLPADSKSIPYTISPREVDREDYHKYNSTTRTWSYSRSDDWPTDTYAYSDAQGYSGTLRLTKISPDAHNYRNYAYPTNPYNGQEHLFARYTNTFAFGGTAYRPNTQVWKKDYSGTVTKPGYNSTTYSTQYNQTYSGIVTKSASDSRIWEQKYSGTVYKGENINYYSYNVSLNYETDTTPPVAPNINLSSTSPTNENLTATISYPIDAITKEYRINNGSWTAYGTDITMTENGTIEARGVDRAGNVSEITLYKVLNIDRVAPTNPTYSVMENQNKIVLSGEINAKSFYRLNDASWVEYKDALILEDGKYKVDMKTIDFATNESEVVSFEVHLYRDSLLEAENYVEKAEKEQTQASVDVANEKVNSIPYGVSEYLPLKDRLQDIQKLIDARNAIEIASITRNEKDIQDAKEKMELLNGNNPIIVDILDDVHTDFEEADILALIARERYDLLSSKYSISKVAYDSLVQTYYAIKYTGDSMYRIAGEKFALVPTSDQHYSLVEKQYNSLNVEYDKFVEERIQTDAEMKAEISVKSMEEKYTPSMAVNTQTLINAVEDATIRSGLQARLDTAKSKYEASLLNLADQTAISAVEKAESTKLSYYISDAYKKVNLLTNETLKVDLTTRLQTLEALMAYEKQLTDATRSVEYAEKYKSDYYLSSAQKKVTHLPDSVEKTALQQRLDNLQSGLPTSDQATIIKKATDYVGLAESVKSQYYVDKAQGYIDQIADGTKKTELQIRLDAIVVK